MKMCAVMEQLQSRRCYKAKNVAGVDSIPTAATGSTELHQECRKIKSYVTISNGISSWSLLTSNSITSALHTRLLLV